LREISEIIANRRIVNKTGKTVNTSVKISNISEKQKMASSDESVVRTRLLLDGDGTGDDRRLNQIAKSVRKGSFLKET